MDADPAAAGASCQDAGSTDRADTGACASTNSSTGGAGEAPAACRICWMEADGDAGGALLSPCSCSGGLKYVHERCLKVWQQSQRAQESSSHLRHCELCHATYSVQLVRPRPKALQLLLAARSTAAQLGIRVLIGEALKKLLEPAIVLSWWQEVMAINMVHVGLKSGWEGFHTGIIWGNQHLVDARLKYVNSCIVWLACLREWGPSSVRQAWRLICPKYLPGPLQLLAQHPLHLALLLKWPQLVPGLLQASHAFALGCWVSLVKQARELTDLGLELCVGGRRLATAVVRCSGRLGYWVLRRLRR